jgi:3-methylcrotonyl-CoA carboxylase alpha subunit
MIESLLIANRGEIACRIIRTARALGVRTVAVYSEADRDALHTRLADQSLPIGPAAAAESYLRPERILAAASETGAQAIHPGYGFLSENPSFADAVKAAGLVWVGPPASAIRAMGLKHAAKKLMAEAGVPVTPGYLGDDQSLERLRKEAAAIGFPVLIKAVAGGGGKGMRKVERAADFATALASCQREAAASFGDDRVLLEKYVSHPRHIEVQVFADRHGNAVHLFERDCSLQRRHQKIIEEAPAPGMDEATRAAVCGAAVRAALAVAYEGAGTVEFIADASGGLRADRIWFMEMNTRLQVEHPVTESITGVDLVEWQLRVASGEKLPRAQHELAIQGHAMEARLYAENPRTGFLPSIGALTHLRMPAGIRVDTGVEQGGVVTPFYDPMIAKLIVHAPSRSAAAAKLAAACAGVEVWPLKTNAAFLAQAASHPEFVAGHVDTGFIETHLAQLVPALEPSIDVLVAGARARLEAYRQPATAWGAATGFRVNAEPQLRVEVQTGGNRQLVLLDDPSDGSLSTASIDAETIVFERGDAFAFNEPQSLEASSGTSSEGAIRAPMPGKIIAVQITDGAAVVKGQALVTIEAMKMEHALTAPFDGVTAGLAHKLGDQVSEGTLLMRITREAAGHDASVRTHPD